jgi:Arc/MetJ-type ribon-helix-helix transcriptional regulator
MTNITVSIPQELCEKMKRHSEVKWSEVVRKALSNYVDRLDIVEGGVVPMKKLAKKLQDSGVDISSINLEQATKYYEEGRKLEWKRLSTTQTSS